MPRPVRCRRIACLPLYRSFSPDDIIPEEQVRMTVDEFEALRLLDGEGLTQEACAARMNVSRTTGTAIYESARHKVADALVHGKRLLIVGGSCEFAPATIPENISEKGSNVGIKWLQSIDEPNFAIPVMDPLAVKNDYNPAVEDELMNPLGKLTEENLLVLVSVNVPSDLTKMTVNLQAPFIINADSRKGCQVIVEGDDNPIKFEIYDILQKNRK